MRGNIAGTAIFFAAVVFGSLVSTPTLHAQESDRRFTKRDIIRGGDIGIPIPTEDGKSRDGKNTPGPGCTITFKSAPGIMGPPCAMKCVGVSADKAPDYQSWCNKMGPMRTGNHPVNDDGTLGDSLPARPDDGRPYCEIFKGSADPWSSGAWFPNGHPRCGGVVGDPHLTTFDGVRYALQSAGEFIVAKSLDDDFEVQARFEPWSISQSVSTTTAVAVQVTPYRVTVASQLETPLRINGEAYDLPDDEYIILTQADAMIIRDGRRYSIVLGDQTNVHVDLINDEVMNVSVLLPEVRDGRMVGLSGDGDDNKENDFALRDGTQLSNPPSAKTLYTEYAESWRVKEGSSLFDYDADESWAGFQNPDMPKEYVDMESIPAADKERAENVCRAAGLRPGPALDDCIYDYALTGDDVFIQSALSTQSPPEFSSAAAAELVDVPQTAITGEDILVVFSGGNIESGDRISVATPEDPPGTFSDYYLIREGSPATLRMPLEAGDYEIRFIEDGETIAALESIRITPARAAITAPDRAEAGELIEVTFTGPVPGDGDRVSIATPEDPPGTFSDYYLTREGSPATLRMPLEAGEYELRFVQGGQKIIARQSIRITPVSATIAAPDTAEAGETIEIVFTGPVPGAGDRVSVAMPDDPPGTFSDYKLTEERSPTTLRMPLDAGDYEIRFVQAGQKIIARESISITPSIAELTAPEAAIAGESIIVAFTGPVPGTGDRVSVAKAEDPPATFSDYKLTEEGSPLTLRMPPEPGDYEIRFVQGGQKIIARKSIKVISE